MLLVGVPAGAQEANISDLLTRNAHTIELQDGALTGPGLVVLLDACREAQFVGIAEEHNVKEICEFTTLLFEMLHDRYSYQFLGLEQGPAAMEWLSSPPYRGDLERIASFARSYTDALTWIIDQELEMIADVGRLSTAPANPVWGIDQEHGALHILERLLELAPDETARTRIEQLIEKTRPHESDRFTSEVLFMASLAQPADFADLDSLFQPAAGSEAEFLIDELQLSKRIFHYYQLGEKGDEFGFYLNNLVREESMKDRFMSYYKKAREMGIHLPRAVLKLGHWHLFRGIYRGNVPTFGNFISEFSHSNGMNTVIISTYIVGSDEEWRNSRGTFAGVADPDAWTLFDLRPLRGLAHMNRIEGMSTGMKQLIFQADFALVFGGAQSGSYDLTRDYRSR